MLKQILIPVAAFAVTVTGASAFNSDLLNKIDVDLTDSQIEVLEEVHELRQSGEVDRSEVQKMLEAADIDQDLMKEIHEATREVRTEMREAVAEAIENNDYNAFLEAIAGTPLEEAVDSEADFEKFAEAHELMQSGDHDGAKEIMSELGIEKGEGHGERGEGRGEGRGRGNGEGKEGGMRDGIGGPGSNMNRL